MNRPFVVCHRVSSVDGQIDGSRFGASEVQQPLTESNAIRMHYNCTATLYGAAKKSPIFSAAEICLTRHC